MRRTAQFFKPLRPNNPAEDVDVMSVEGFKVLIPDGT